MTHGTQGEGWRNNTSHRSLGLSLSISHLLAVGFMKNVREEETQEEGKLLTAEALAMLGGIYWAGTEAEIIVPSQALCTNTACSHPAASPPRSLLSARSHWFQHPITPPLQMHCNDSSQRTPSAAVCESMYLIVPCPRSTQLCPRGLTLTDHPHSW